MKYYTEFSNLDKNTQIDNLKKTQFNIIFPSTLENLKKLTDQF